MCSFLGRVCVWFVHRTETKSIVNYDDDDTYMKDSARSIGYEFHIPHSPQSSSSSLWPHLLAIIVSERASSATLNFWERVNFQSY